MKLDNFVVVVFESTQRMSPPVDTTEKHESLSLKK